jgi:hypothetical protein
MKEPWNGKTSKSRVTDKKKFNENYDKIDTSKPIKKSFKMRVNGEVVK